MVREVQQLTNEQGELLVTEEISWEETESTLKNEKNLSTQRLRKICETSFSDVFVLWTHLKVLRLFIESTLLYGFTSECVFTLIQITKKNRKQIKGCLEKVLAALEKPSFESDNKSEYEQEQYYALQKMQIKF